MTQPRPGIAKLFQGVVSRLIAYYGMLVAIVWILVHATAREFAATAGVWVVGTVLYVIRVKLARPPAPLSG